MDRAQLGKLLYKFESENTEAIGKLQINKFLIWSIAKPSIFFFPFEQTSESNSGSSKSNNSVVTKLKSILGFLINLFLVLLKCIGRKKIVILFNSTINKKTKNNKGEHFNFITDPYVTEGVLHTYLNIEYTVGEKVQGPSTVKTDLNIDGLFSLSILLRLFISKRKIKRDSQKLEGLLNDFFNKSNVKIQIDCQFIEQILINFYTDYKLCKALFSLLKPKIIISSEKIGSGVFGAAIDLNISSIDIQHGVVDPFDGMYQYSPNLLPYKQKMVIPTEIGVWGIQFKKLMLEKGFWEEKEVRVLGNHRINSFKDNFKRSNADSTIILFPTQWPFFEEAMELLNKLKVERPHVFNLKIKIHPIEPDNFVKQYEEFAEQNKEWVSISYPAEDIYKLIAHSKVVLGFNSTSLIEAINLGIPAISLTTRGYNQGVHYYLGTSSLLLKNSIKVISYQAINELILTLNAVISDADFYQNWLNELKSSSSELYAEGFKENAEKQIADLLN
ncbi:hypothetical protein I5M27_01875 [Adhaeribacter sp. BT258]|uniref:Uncharacterized protein n=1 Tax=Adhaeribacter terrigena TaxID=2793070 RepID=A0ABS1BX45_9BACT|nr:hypothetical protein [Adhaeribacter terrigena]MBK0401713.1 hypothetical protein [Adhaeribacter terrigena]